MSTILPCHPQKRRIMMAFYHFCTLDFLINIASGRINQAINSTTQVISIENFAIRLITLHRIVHWTATTGTQQNRIDQIRKEQNGTEHNRTEENRKPHLTLPHLQSVPWFLVSQTALPLDSSLEKGVARFSRPACLYV